jgi:hypothetical protein
VSPLLRPPQLRGTFVAGDPTSGYYNDIRPELRTFATPAAGLERFASLTVDPVNANPVTIVQLGIGAWQRRSEDPGWEEVVDRVVGWVTSVVGEDGVITYRFPMAHTYHLEPPWASAMAQGEAASLLVRGALLFDRPELIDVARALVGPLVDERSPLVAPTPEGPVLQEYPTTPPAHVLNGWIYGLWGLYDVAVGAGDTAAQSAFDAGVGALGDRLHLYRTGWRWSRYDLYPHPLVHAASPFYHRMHVEQLRAMKELVPDPRFEVVADEWSASMRNPVAIGLGTAGKVAFRLVRPRKRSL